MNPSIKALGILILIGLISLSIMISPYGLFGLALTFISIVYHPLRPYVLSLWISVDQTVNATIFGNEDNTMSGRIGALSKSGNATAIELEKFVDFLFYKGHCKDAIERDEKVFKQRYK